MPWYVNAMVSTCLVSEHLPVGLVVLCGSGATAAPRLAIFVGHAIWHVLTHHQAIHVRNQLATS